MHLRLALMRSQRRVFCAILVLAVLSLLPKLRYAIHRQTSNLLSVLLQTPPLQTPRCKLSGIAVGAWEQWPLRRNNRLIDPRRYPPVGENLFRLRQQLPLALPPHPFVASFPVPALPPASADAAAPTTLLLILVKSAPANADFRQAVRDTWGDLSYWPQGCLLRFLVGSPASKDLQAEASQHGDVIVHGEGDGYRNNTRKLLAGLFWANRNIPKLRFLLFIDDDVLLNPFAMRPMLSSAEDAVANFAEGKHLLSGYLIKDARPVRNGDKLATCRDKKKWALSYMEYPLSRYPNFLSAGWLFMSADLLPDLLWAAGFVTPRIPLDDVYLGLLAAKLHLPLTDMSAVLSMDSKLLSEKPRPENLLALHGYNSNQRSGAARRLKMDWKRLLMLHCAEEGEGSDNALLSERELRRRGVDRKKTGQKQVDTEAWLHCL